MRKNNPVSIVQNTVETYADRPKKMKAELRRLLKEGEEAQDLLMIGAIWPKYITTPTMSTKHFCMRSKPRPI